MSITEVLDLSLTAILANKLRSFLTILGIVIGVTSVILLISVVTGLKSFITDQISSFGSNLIFVIPGKTGTSGRGPGGSVINRLDFEIANNLKKELKNQAEISAVTQKAVTTKFGSLKSENLTMSGVENNYPKIITALKIEKGRFFNQAESNAGKKVIVIGPSVAKNLFNSQDPIGKDIQINSIKYEVIGVTKSRGASLGFDQDNSAFIPLETIKKQFGVDKPNAIYISANKTDQIIEVQDKASAIIEKKISKDDFTVQNQEQSLETISKITSVLTLALGGIATISLIVGGIGVMNIMLVSVTERTKEIGLRKAIGAKPKDIRNQFLIEAITLSSFGGVIGIILGFALSQIINIFFQTIVPLWAVALSFGFSMIVGIIFGVTPAIRASRLNPIQALRYE